jgi:hypothetical protein
MGLLVLGISNSNDGISIADTSVPDNEVTSSIGNSSTSATITITMYAVADE